MMVTYTKIGSEAEPSQIWGEQPPGSRVNLSPDVGQVSNCATESENVDCCSNGATQAKVERRPQEVQGELDGVEGGSMLRHI